MKLTSKIIILTPSKDDTIHNQTIDVFEQASKYFHSIIRIWITLNDIDENYLEFSEARNSVFEKYGYPIGSRTFVSTCVGSKNPLTVKLLIVPNIKQEQISFIDLPSYMPHTNKYGVAFERASKVEFGNSTHYYISGTASIDETGEVLNKGDVVAQTKRAMLIIKKLLNKNNINIDEIYYLKWYVRNESDIPLVEEEINKIKQFNNHIDIYFEQAEICRKDWLVEVECFALSYIGNHKYEEFVYEI